MIKIITIEATLYLHQEWAEALLELCRKFEAGEVNPGTACDPVSLRGGLMELREALDEAQSPKEITF